MLSWWNNLNPLTQMLMLVGLAGFADGAAFFFTALVPDNPLFWGALALVCYNISALSFIFSSFSLRKLDFTSANQQFALWLASTSLFQQLFEKFKLFRKNTPYVWLLWLGMIVLGVIAAILQR